MDIDQKRDPESIGGTAKLEASGSEASHVEELAAANAPSLSPEHAEFLMRRHGTLNLNPVPSMSPADPLNWPSWKKHANLCLVAFHAMMATFIAAGIIPAYHLLAEDMHVSIQTTSYLTGAQILFLGIAPIFWIPVSNRFGRRPIFLLSTVVSGLFGIGCAMSKSYAVMMVCRCIQAIFMSPPLAIGSRVVVETSFKHERGQKLGIWTLLVTLGPPLGPFIMGFVSQGWEWVYWIFSIINAVEFIGFLLFSPETRYIESDARKTSQFRAEYIQVRRIDPTPFSIMDFFGPLKMMRHIDLMVPAFSYAIVFGFCSVAIIVEIPQLFGPLFGLSTQQIGLQFLSLIIGTLLGELCSGPVSDIVMKRYNKAAALKGRRPHAEHRLWLSYFGFICCIVGFVVFCMQMKNAVPMHWNITPLIGIAIMGFGNQVVTTVLVTYAIDCHPEHSAWVGIVISLVRQTWGFILPFWIPQMFENLGYSGSAGLMAGLLLVVSIVPIAILQWTRSRNVQLE